MFLLYMIPPEATFHYRSIFSPLFVLNGRYQVDLCRVVWVKIKSNSSYLKLSSLFSSVLDLKKRKFCSTVVMKSKINLSKFYKVIIHSRSWTDICLFYYKQIAIFNYSFHIFILVVIHKKVNVFVNLVRVEYTAFSPHVGQI